MHRRNSLQFGMVVFLDQLQIGLDCGYGLFTFSSLAVFPHGETGQIFGHIQETA